MNVALYSGTTSKYAYSAATKSGATVKWSAVAAGTYNVYASKNSGATTTLVDTGVDVTVSATGAATINYYVLTLNKGTGVASTSGAASYLSNQTASIGATMTTGYTFTSWTVGSGNTPASTTTASTTVAMSKATTLTANAADKTAPSVTITRTDYNTFKWTASDGVGVTGYAITTSSTTPTTWTTTGTLTSGTKDIDASTAATYYVWAKDAAGNVGKATIASYKVTKSQGTGTTLTIKEGSTAIGTTCVLKGTVLTVTATANAGYNSVSLTVGGNAFTSGNTTTINAATTIASTANANTTTITINKDGSAWSSSGMNVALYSGTTSKYAYSAATVSGSTVKWTGVAAGTYNVYAGKNSGAKTTLVDTGVDVTVSTTGTATINYYTLTVSKGTGVASVTGGAVYLKNQTASFSGTASDGYRITGTTYTGNTPSPVNAPDRKTLTFNSTVKLTQKTTITINGAVNNYVEYCVPFETVGYNDFTTNGYTAVAYYTTLNEAFTYATDSNSIAPMKKSLTETTKAKVPLGKKIRMDLQCYTTGCKIYFETGGNGIENAGTLRIHGGSGSLGDAQEEKICRITSNAGNTVYNTGSFITRGAWEITSTGTSNSVIDSNGGYLNPESGLTVKAQNNVVGINMRNGAEGDLHFYLVEVANGPAIAVYDTSDCRFKEASGTGRNVIRNASSSKATLHVEGTITVERGLKIYNTVGKGVYVGSTGTCDLSAPSTSALFGDIAITAKTVAIENHGYCWAEKANVTSEGNVVINYGNFTSTDSEFKGTGGASTFYNRSGTADISGRLITAETDRPIWNDSGARIILGGGVTVTSSMATAEGVTNYGILDINNATIRSTGSNAIAGHGDNSIIRINQPSSNTSIVNTIESTVATAIWLDGGRLTIGTNESNSVVNSNSPIVTGATYGVYNKNEAATIGFYDGYIEGAWPSYGAINHSIAIPTGSNCTVYFTHPTSGRERAFVQKNRSATNSTNSTNTLNRSLSIPKSPDMDNVDLNVIDKGEKVEETKQGTPEPISTSDDKDKNDNENVVEDTTSQTNQDTNNSNSTSDSNKNQEIVNKETDTTENITVNSEVSNEQSNTQVEEKADESKSTSNSNEEKGNASEPNTANEPNKENAVDTDAKD